ncbi:aspartate-semialdehyde dehydrogenase [Candidatus Sumerlaeota bacterium]|nr:aspartate-semialdehyde dehydrogenase [Candidatus Sumerlaeota bacterium]
MKVKTAILGVTGAVGQEFLKLLVERDFPLESLKVLASARSAGKTVEFKGQTLTIEEATPEAFDGVELVLSSAGGSVSKKLVPEAVKRGAVVVDNTSAFRMDEGVPLIVPEVNRHVLKEHRGIIANPNCSTIIMVLPLKPLHDRWGVRRVICSTYQAVSGAGWTGIRELEQQVADLAAGREPKIEVFPQQIAYNAIPRIPQSGGVFDDGYLHEEVKMIKETVKIFGDESIHVTATCVRIPVIRCHSETLNVELVKPFTLDEVREALAGAEGVTVQDDVANNVYPVPLACSFLDDVFVGRLRVDNTLPQAVNMWICGDQIKKGAALNAIQIAEDLIRQDLVRVPA